MKKLFLSIAALFFCGAGLAGPPPEVMKQALRQAGLSAEQIKKIEGIIFSAEDKKLQIAHRLEKARLELKQALAEEKPDRQAVLELAERIGRLETELHKNRLTLVLDIRAQMTGQQWAQIEDFHFRWKRELRRPEGQPAAAESSPPQP